MPSAKAIKARNRKYYKRNAESIRSQSRDNYKKNPLNKKAASCDYSKARYSADPQKVRAAPREKYNINPEPKMEASHGHKLPPRCVLNGLEPVPIPVELYSKTGCFKCPTNSACKMLPNNF